MPICFCIVLNLYKEETERRKEKRGAGRLVEVNQSPPLKVIDLDAVKAVSAEATYLQEKILRSGPITGLFVGKPWHIRHNV